MLSKNKIKTISGIFANIGHIFLGSVALPFWFESKEVSSFLMALAGLFIAVCFWAVSISLIE